MEAVWSVLCESTTMNSSAQATDWSAAAMFAASSRVMTVTVSFTRRSLSHPAVGAMSALLYALGAPPPSALARRLRASLGPQALPCPLSLVVFLSSRRNRLHRLERDERAVVGEDRIQLGELC